MKQSTEEFDSLYKILNPEQQDAVDTIEGPVMVIAGPGTGKTQILTLRIANILKNTDVPADAILALTFTNAAAANMRKRLVEIIGSDAYRVSIYTFHSFANYLIETYPERFSEIIGRSNCSEVERIDIVRSIVDVGRYNILRPLGDPYYNVPHIIGALSHLKREGITPELYKTWLADERALIESAPDTVHSKGPHKGKMKSAYIKQLRALEKNEELADVYSRYQRELAAKKRYDFDDSLLMLIAAMEKDENFLRELQEEYQYFLVDEHQDTNGAQNRILELMISYFDTPNVFVVGDEKQAIFRFQGASLANFLYFEKKFTEVKRITLSSNYRSTQDILDAAHALIQQNIDTIEAPLVSKTKNDGTEKVHVYRFDSDDEELLYLVENVQKKIKSGVPAHEIAVLYRNNRDVDAIADYFERLSVPFLIESGHGVLDDPDIRKVNQILGALHDLTDDDLLAQVLFIDFFHIPIEDVYTILHHARKEKQPVYKTMRDSLSSGELTQPETVRGLLKQLAKWKQQSENESFLLLFESVVRESGVLERIQESSFHTEKFDKLVRLFDEVKALVRRNTFFTLHDYVHFLNILRQHNLTLEARSRQVPNAVRLMTAHKAKGLEFDYVHIVHAYDGHWGGKRARRHFLLPHRSGAEITTQQDVEDERRLFYVAITRARKKVYVTYASMGPDGKDRVPSQFIEEIHPELKKVSDGTALGYAGKRPPLFVERKGIHGKEKYEAFVASAFQERGLSATAVNNYLTCPWKWFYENFFYTQFVPSATQQKGTAVHRALEQFFKKRAQGKRVTKQTLLSACKTELAEQDIEPHVLEKLTTDTLEALSGWYDARHNSWPDEMKSEFLVRGVLLDTDIRLTGKIDALECLDDRCREVRVVDFKTGKPKSRNEIEGTTKSAQYKAGSGGYKRQLVFYNLLLDRYNEGQYRMKEGVLDFIEPMQSGTYKRESFTISREETDELIETIRRISEEIRTLSFWNTHCDDPKCSACSLRELM